MITEIRLQSNNGERTAAFWSAIFDVAAEDLGPDRWGLHSWRISPAAAPAVVVSTARVVETISRHIDITVVVDAGASDRLRALGFEVADDGSQAVDVNGTDSTVFLVTPDPISPDFYEDDPDDGKVHAAELMRRSPDAAAASPTRLSLMVIYVPAPRVELAAKFYAAILNVEPVREQHGGPEHWSVSRGSLTIELYPVGDRIHTSSRFEFAEDAVGAVARLTDRAFALPERTPDGRGWWCRDPCGNTVILLP
ncbi:VOC family protein [Mycolicibacterium nivoides]|uniref:VOC family protein n=1 Tax=Mycolicibacterium nivoides TaxID=2487344 RepID=UPI001F15227D|nr:VOC family protein [Mycolicibacterium nivoides]